jgi:hypothetical protein
MLEWAVGGGLAWAQALAPAIVPAATKATASLAAATRRLTLSAIPSSQRSLSFSVSADRMPRPTACQRNVCWGGRNGGAPVETALMIEVSRTLMKSEPELAELVESVDGVEVTMAEKGFGTRVEIRAGADSGLGVDDLERLLDDLAEPRKQPFK